jgi:hypothetical protein
LCAAVEEFYPFLEEIPNPFSEAFAEMIYKFYLLSFLPDYHPFI